MSEIWLKSWPIENLWVTQPQWYLTHDSCMLSLFTPCKTQSVFGKGSFGKIENNYIYWKKNFAFRQFFWRKITRGEVSLQHFVPKRFKNFWLNIQQTSFTKRPMFDKREYCWAKPRCKISIRKMYRLLIQKKIIFLTDAHNALWEKKLLR